MNAKKPHYPWHRKDLAPTPDERLILNTIESDFRRIHKYYLNISTSTEIHGHGSGIVFRASLSTILR